jgi:hypothetical protein
MPNGAIYEPGARKVTEAKAGPVVKARAAEVKKAAAIAELEKAADQWEQKAHDGAYTLAKEVKAYYLDKSRSARREAARLRGEDVPEPKPVSKTVVVSR